jgi:iron(III) transport system permease protein
MSLRRGTVLRGLALALLAVLFVYPLGRLVALPFLDGWHAIRCWTALANSAGFALLVGLIAALTGTLLAQALEAHSGKTMRALDLGLWLLFLTPGYVLTTGWLVILANPAIRHSPFGQLFLGPAGLVFLYTLKALPFAVFMARATFAAAGAGLGEAALVLGLAPWRRFLLRLRLALPAMAAAFSIAAIETMQEFGIPATLGLTARIPILTYEIYQRLNTTPTDFSGAAALCWWLIGSAALLALLQSAVQRHHQAALVHGRTRPTRRSRLAPANAALLAAGTALLWGLGLVAPLAGLIGIALSGAVADTDSLDAVPRSLGYGMLAATLAFGAGLIILKLQQGRSVWFSGLLQGLLAANLAVPGLILGAGYVIAFNNDVLPLYGTALLLVIAYAAGALPAAIRLLGNALGQLDAKLDEAARIFALPLATRLIDIEAALLARPGLQAWLLVVGAVMFELPVSELLYVPGAMPLGVAIVSADMMARYDEAARLALLGMAMLAVLAVLLNLGLRLADAPRPRRTV